MMIKIKILRFIYQKILRTNPAKQQMVSYWKTKEYVSAKITKAKDGSIIMKMEGEKYPFPGFCRGHLLFGLLSPLKHQIKNQIFNESWAKLEANVPHEDIIDDIRAKLNGPIAKIASSLKYDMLPPVSMCPAVREIHRAWTKIGGNEKIRDYLCFILQEDDAYRFRCQFLVGWFGWFLKINPVKHFEKALKVLEIGEIIGDMKERQRLLRRILLLYLEDNHNKEMFNKLFREINWKKVKLTKADKYHFRGKYFRVDLDKFDY